MAIDLPGFGQSERSDVLLSSRAMGEFVVRVANAFGLEHPHVVGPDVGTGAALYTAALYPGRLRSLVVGSGGVAFPLHLGGVLKEAPSAFVNANSVRVAYRPLGATIMQLVENTHAQ